MQRGKWSQQGVPHKGWQCDDIEDLGEPTEVCQMCESQPIRFVHYMSHPNYPSSLACGCDCAGHMEGSLKRAEQRDRAMKNAASRRKNFPNLKSWKVSPKGNSILKKDGRRITVFRSGKRFKFVINHPNLPDGKFSRSAYDTEQEAQLAAFDAIVWLDDNWQNLL